LATSNPPSRYTAATIDSYTAAARLLGIWLRELMPLPMMSKCASSRIA
jgi:hypothetical protein